MGHRKRRTVMASDQESANHVVIFRTGKLWEFDLARDALRQNGIPFFARTDSVSGVRTALDAMPMQAPGIFWCLIVPKKASRRAKQILRTCRLDVEKQPLIWDFAPGPKGKKFWKTYALFVLVLAALFLIVSRILMYR
jgi:hypothetical protein